MRVGCSYPEWCASQVRLARVRDRDRVRVRVWVRARARVRW